MNKNINIKSIGCTFAAAAIMASNTQAGAPVVMPDIVEPSCPWSIGLEALSMKAHGGDEYSSQDYEFAYRLDASYQFADNMGIRLTYFQFDGTDDDESYDDGYYSGYDNYYPEISTWDLELFDGFTLGSWTGEYSAGIRFGSFDSKGSYYENYDDGYEEEYGSGNAEFEGWGPTLAIELTRPLGANFSFYAGARASWLFGDVDGSYKWSETMYGDDYGSGSGSTDEDDVSLLVLEGSLGLQYDFQLFSSCPSYVRLGMEAQTWESITSYDDGDDTGLFGGSLRFGFNF